MANDIYLSNLSGQFDYQSILQKYQQLKFQQVNLIQQKEQKVQQKEAAFKSFANLLKNFRSDFETLEDTQLFEKKSVTVSNEDVASVSVTDPSKLQEMNLEFSVDRLASKDVWLSQSGVSSKEDTVATEDGTLTLSIDGSDIDIDYSASDSLSQIVDKINDSSDKVSASLFFDGDQYRLLISSTQTGDDQSISMSDSADLLDNLKLGDDGDGSHVQSAQNAQIDIFGQKVQSQSNTFSNLLDGLTLEVKRVSSDPVQINITADEKSAQKAFERVLGDYNSLVDYIKEVTDEKGPLGGDYTLHSIRSQLFNQLTPLMEKGLLNVDHKSGHLSLDQSKFEELYREDKDSLESMRNKLVDTLDPYLDTLFEPFGVIKQKERSYERQIRKYEDNIASVVQRIEKESEIMKKEFIHLDSLMAQMNDIQTRLAAILPKQESNT